MYFFETVFIHFVLRYAVTHWFYRVLKGVLSLLKLYTVLNELLQSGGVHPWSYVLKPKSMWTHNKSRHGSHWITIPKFWPTPIPRPFFRNQICQNWSQYFFLKPIPFFQNRFFFSKTDSFFPRSNFPKTVLFFSNIGFSKTKSETFIPIPISQKPEPKP